MAPSIQLPEPQINGTEYRAGPIFWLIDFSLWEKEKFRQGKNKKQKNIPDQFSREFYGASVTPAQTRVCCVQ